MVDAILLSEHEMDVNDVFDFMEETSTPAEPSSKKEKEEESDLLQVLENTVYV